MDRLLRGHYSSFIALTDSFANPHLVLLFFGCSPRLRSLCRLLPAPAASGTFPTLFCESFLRCLSPCPSGPLSAFAWFFLRVHRPSPTKEGSAFPHLSANTIFHGPCFGAAAISLCSSLPACSPSRSFLPLQMFPQGSQGFYLRAERCVVTCTTGNRRYEDLHLAGFAALSAAHLCTSDSPSLLDNCVRPRRNARKGVLWPDARDSTKGSLGIKSFRRC